MNSPSEGRLLGDYRLLKLVNECSLTYTWFAKQESIGRSVLVDELRPEQAHLRDEFLANVRAKASLDHPLIASIYEAVTDEATCYFAHELLSGATLQERKAAREPLQPAQMVHVIKRLAEVNLQLENQGIATAPVSLDVIHVDATGVIRLRNPALGGARSSTSSSRDIAFLGKAMVSLVADGKAGATRVLTLLSWMRGEGIEDVLNWQQVAEICQQIETQLEGPEETPVDATAGKSRIMITTVIAAIALATVFGTALVMRGPEKVKLPPRVELPEPVLIPMGKHIGVDGTKKDLGDFMIGAHEVTIGEYAEFMKILASLETGGRQKVFDHKDQPADKVSHAPDDWENLMRCAKSGVLWKGRLVTLDSPVVGVDWWDCAAYAEWKRARLPTQDEWRAALGAAGDVAAKVPAADWAPVDPQTKDQSRFGVLNLAGSVCEWTSEPAINPANPLGARKWVIMGGSFLKNGSNALSLEWVDDRSLRRSDLGFRVIYDIGK